MIDASVHRGRGRARSSPCHHVRAMPCRGIEDLAMLSAALQHVRRLPRGIHLLRSVRGLFWTEKGHRKKCQEGCRATLRDQAERKKMAAKRLFEDFNAKMDHCLRTGEDLGPRFAAIAQATVPTTSKKRFKHKRIRLEGDW